jgi:hypothetical protein
VSRGRMTVSRDERLWWHDSKEGLCDKVLDPWVPLDVAADKGTVAVRPWGRLYAFSGSPFPTLIESAGASLLAAPVQVVAWAEGQLQEWCQATLTVQQKGETGAVLAGGSFSELLAITSVVEVEYDGMIRLDWRLEPRRSVRLDCLAFEVLLKTEHAKYLYFYPGRWGSTYNACSLPTGGVGMEFRPFVWLGDEERGLAWFCESDHNWLSDAPENVIEVKPVSDAVLLRLHLIDKPLQLTPGASELDRQKALAAITEPLGALSYTFGLQATPVKPVVKDAWDYRISHAGDYGIESLPIDYATLTYPANGNIQLECGTLEFWAMPTFGYGYAHGLTRPLFTLDLPGTGTISLFWSQDDYSLHFRIREGAKTVAEVKGAASWVRGGWHHIAVSWGDALKLYLDGELVDEDDYKGTLEAPLEDRLLVFGGASCGYVLDEIRISWIARSPQEVVQAAKAEAPYSHEDMHTLLLDHLDNTYDPGYIEHLDSYGTFTRPAIFGRRFGGQAGRDMIRYCSGWTGAGLVDGSARFVRGKFGYGLQLGGFEEPVADRLARLGVRTVCFHEHWTPWQSYPYSAAFAREMRSLVQGLHERGLQLLLYYGFDLSTLCPEFEAYHDECLVKPTNGGRLYTCTPAPQQRVATVCYNSVWQDHLVAGIARMMDEFDIDGVYLDGTANPHACTNLKHGCGYIRADGSVAPTYPIFAVRNTMRRIYTVVKSRKPDGQVNVHQSTCMTIPTLAWATSLWDGEQFGHIEPGSYALDLLPLDAFRTEFMGHQWGVPQEFLCYERPYSYLQACSFALLHDVPVRAIGPGPNLEIAAKLWRTFDEFGRKESAWLPYWRNARYVNVSPQHALASIYWHPRNGVLAVVSNLGRKAAKVEVRVDLLGLGISGGVEAADILNDRPLVVEGGRFELQLEPLGWSLIWLQPKSRAEIGE